jgi:hypothetical protein
LRCAIEVFASTSIARTDQHSRCRSRCRTKTSSLGNASCIRKGMSSTLPLCARVLPLTLLLAACGPSEEVPSSSLTKTGSASGDSSHVDSGVPAPGVLLEMFGKAKSCSDACADYGFSCTGTCTLPNGAPVVGWGNYYPEPDTFLHACTEPLPSEQRGTQLQSSQCCCTAPQAEVIIGTFPPRSCRQLCASQGLRCDPSAWNTYPGYSTTTGSYTYHCPGFNTVGVLASCDEALGTTLPKNRDCQLRSYGCSCIR